jgi:hypothetical protein
MEKPPDGQDDFIKKVQGTIVIPFPDTFLYSNCSALATSFMDFHIGFAEATPDQGVKSRVGIVMPPEHAVRLAMSLMQHITSFEDAFGEIRNPEWQFFKARVIKDASPMLYPQVLLNLQQRIAELSEEDQGFIREATELFEREGGLPRASVTRLLTLFRRLGADAQASEPKS